MLQRLLPEQLHDASHFAAYSAWQCQYQMPALAVMGLYALLWRPAVALPVEPAAAEPAAARHRVKLSLTSH